MIASQHGVVARRQALAAGMTPGQIRSRAETGVWTTLWPGVYAPAVVADSWRRHLMGACLAGDMATVASHRAAGALWRFDGRPSGIVEVTTAGLGSRSLRGVILHRTRALETVDITELEGIPVTRPARTLIDLAAVLAADPLEACLDGAFREGLVSLRYLEKRLAELGSRGRDGTEILRDLIADRRNARPADSQAENRVRRALLDAGLPPPVRQHELPGVARFDLAYPDRRIGIEFESYRFHADKRTWRRDQSKHNRATAMGWRVFHLTADLDVTPVVLAYAA